MLLADNLRNIKKYLPEIKLENWNWQIFWEECRKYLPLEGLKACFWQINWEISRNICRKHCLKA